jgi:type VI secretion system secreted protein Hcp
MSSPISRATIDVDSAGQCSLGLRGDTTLGDVVVVKELDKSSPKIQDAVCDGTFFEKVIIDFVSSTKRRGQEPYLRYELKNVFVTSYSVGAGTNGEGEAVPIEEVSLNYGEIKFEYVPTKGKGDNDNKP